MLRLRYLVVRNMLMLFSFKWGSGSIKKTYSILLWTSWKKDIRRLLVRTLSSSIVCYLNTHNTMLKNWCRPSEQFISNPWLHGSRWNEVQQRSDRQSKFCERQPTIPHRSWEWHNDPDKGILTRYVQRHERGDVPTLCDPPGSNRLPWNRQEVASKSDEHSRHKDYAIFVQICCYGLYRGPKKWTHTTLSSKDWDTLLLKKFDVVLSRKWQFKELMSEETFQSFVEKFPQYVGEDHPERRENKQRR